MHHLNENHFFITVFTFPFKKKLQNAVNTIQLFVMFLENNAKKNNFACFWFLQLQFSCLLSKFPSFITFFFCYLLHIYLVKSKKCTHNLQQALLNLSVGRCQRCTWMLYLVVTQCLVDVIDLPGCSSCHLIPHNRNGCT